MGLPSSNRLAAAVLLKLYLGAQTPQEDATRSGEVADVLDHCFQVISTMTSSNFPVLQLLLLNEIEAVGYVRHEKPIAVLLRKVHEACGQSLRDCLEAVMRALESPDDLITLLTLIQDMLTPPACPTVDGRFLRPTHIEPDSVFGVFLRQLLLDCNGLDFEGLAFLLDDIKAEMWAICPLSSQSPERSSSCPPTQIPVLSSTSQQAQKYLQRRILDLEQEGGRDSYEDVEEEIEALLQQHPELPRGQFLRYLNSSRHREVAGALDALHRYFDYAIRRGGPNATGKTSSSRNIVQYAALNLAALHLRLGHTDLAFAAIGETVRAAQQNSDHACMAFALGWLSQLLTLTGDPQAEEILFRCLTRAGDQKLRYLESSTALSLAAAEARGGSRLHAGEPLAGLSPPPRPVPSATCVESAYRRTGPSGGTTTGFWGGGRLAVGLEGSRPRAVWNLLRRSVVAETAGLAPPLGIAAPPQTTGPPQPVIATLAASLTSALASRDAFPLTWEEGLQLANRRCAVTAAAWEQLGHREMTLLQARKLLYCASNGYGAEAGAEGDLGGGTGSKQEVCLARVKLALGALKGRGGDGLEAAEGGSVEGDFGSEEEVGGAGLGTRGAREPASSLGQGAEKSEGRGGFRPRPLTQMAFAHPGRRGTRPGGNICAHKRRGERQLSLYEIALTQLARAQDEFAGSSGAMLPIAMTLLEHEAAVQSGKWRRAYEAGLRLRSLSALPNGPAAGVQGKEAFVEGQLQWTFALLESGRVSACVEASQRLADLCGQLSLPLHHIRCLIQLGRAHLRGCPVDPSSALPSVLRSLTLSERLDVDSLHASATLLLAQIHLRLGFPIKARALLRAALPILLEHSPVQEQGEAWITLAHCGLQDLPPFEAMTSPSATSLHTPKDTVKGPGGLRGAYLDLLDILERAASAFERSQGLRSLQEVYYLQARLHDALSQCLPGDEAVEKGGLGKETENERCGHKYEREEAATRFFEVVRSLRLNSHWGVDAEMEEHGGNGGWRCEMRLLA